jgi:hypothetical protein
MLSELTEIEVEGEQLSDWIDLSRLSRCRLVVVS